MNDHLVAYLDEQNQHNGFWMIHLLWGPMVKTTRGWILLQGTVANASDIKFINSMKLVTPLHFISSENELFH